MSLYRVSGFVAGAEINTDVEAVNGAEAVKAAAEPHVPAFKGAGREWPKVRREWWVKNVRLSARQLS